MSIPVVIPAYNEAEHMPRLISALDRQTEPVEPIVVDNGSTDLTADVARNLGATVLCEEESGQLRAIQKGLGYVVGHNMILMTDADSEPGDQWAETMLMHSQGLQSPAMLTGTLDFFYPKTPSLQTLRFARRIYIEHRARQNTKCGRPLTMHGSNAALVNVDEQLNDSLLKLPNIGLNNDQAIANEFLEVGGRLVRVTDKNARVKTEGDRYPSMISAARYLIKGKEQAFLSEGSRFADLEVFDVQSVALDLTPTSTTS